MVEEEEEKRTGNGIITFCPSGFQKFLSKELTLEHWDLGDQIQHQLPFDGCKNISNNVAELISIIKRLYY